MKEVKYDVVVVGSGVGGMSTALACALLGARVLVLEKADKVGGTTAWSGGVAWMPAHSRMAEVGHSDTAQNAARYLKALTGNRGNPKLIDTFCENAGTALDFFESQSQVAFSPRAISPDYQPDLPGAAPGGRAMDPRPITEDEVGPSITRLRAPISTFTFGGTMLTAPDLKNLILAGRSLPAAIGAVRLCLRIAAARVAGKPAGPRTLGNALAARLLKSLIDEGVEIETNAPVTGLEVADGRVCGVHTAQGLIHAKAAVVLASGGFPQSADQRDVRIAGTRTTWSMAPPENTGTGIRLVEAASGQIGDHQGRNAHFAPVSLYPDGKGEVTPFPHLLLDRAKPGVIAINGRGKRFGNEADSYHDFVLAMLADGDAVPAYLICDAKAMWRYGLGRVGPLWRGRRAALKSGYLMKARDISGLAKTIGVAQEALGDTISRFNIAARAGEDADFGKGSSAYNRYMGDALLPDAPCLAPLEKAPFYAVEIWPGDLGTSSGAVTNEHAQVLGTDNTPIPGLYAAGNDMNSVCAGAYPGSGGTIGPALTFAYLAARHICTDAITRDSNTSLEKET